MLTTVGKGIFPVDGKTGSQAGRYSDRQTGRQADGSTDRQTGQQAGRRVSRQAGRQADRSAGRQTGRRPSRQTENIDRFWHIISNSFLKSCVTSLYKVPFFCLEPKKNFSKLKYSPL